jgi:hypothetical protein
MIANPCFHCWRYAQRLMNPAKVVVHEWSATACSKFSSFFEKAFVSRVNRRICIRMVKFWRST